jgi:1-acyl-sn-glycerol-3-phosphate acyltransferase
MQQIVLDEPYRFVPPVRGTFWPNLLGPALPAYLRRAQGIHRVEYRGVERLRASFAAGHGVMLTPNHCRPGDPMVVMQLCREAGRMPFTMASWHLFRKSAFQRLVLRAMGVFSVYREGLDREALKYAMQVLEDADRPLVLFPEGVISRTNDRLNHLMEGTAFIARAAARQKGVDDPRGKVVIHPVAIRYFYEGDVEKAVLPVLERIEHQLSWKPQAHLPLVERIVKIGEALLALKEIEYFGRSQTGDLSTRLATLIDRLLTPLEEEWLKGRREGDVVSRVKNLRIVMLPDMVAGEVSEDERTRRWKHLGDMYLAQQLSFYPPGYFTPAPTAERILETVERYEEDLTDQVTLHRPIRAVAEVGEAIEVPVSREKYPDGDPIMTLIRRELEQMLAALTVCSGARL